MEVMDRPTDWTPERLEQAALNELVRHGSSEKDLRHLREYFRPNGANIVSPAMHLSLMAAAPDYFGIDPRVKP